jgi:hypothetical protein
MADRRADHIVEMALFGDVEWIAVVRAERDEGREALGHDRQQRQQVLGDRAFAHEDVHALADLLQRLLGGRAFMFRADTGREIAIEVVAGEQRCMAIDMAALEGLQLGKTDRVLVDDAGEIHEFRKPDDLGMVAEGQEALDRQVGAGRLQMGGGHAARKLHANIHDGFERAVEEELDALGAEHIGDLVRIADDGRHAIGQDAAVKFMRRDQRGFDVQMGIDETGNDDAAGNVDFGATVVVAAGADDALARDGDIRGDELTRHEIEELPALQHDIGRLAAGSLIDEAFQVGHGEVSESV